MQNLTSIVETYNKNGIVKVRDFFDPKEISLCKDQYNEVCKTASDEISRDEPIVVLWTHVQGASKKIAKLSELPSFDKLIKQKLIPFLSDFVANSYPSINSPRLQLLETIVFNKPPQISNTLNWHQDVSYFPLQPNNQIAIWQRFINWLRGMLYLPIDTDENERQATRKDFRQKLVIIGEALKKYSSDVNSNKRRKGIL